MRVPIDNLGSAGLIKDIFSHDTPPEAWTDIRNARMGPYGVERFLGHIKALGTATGWAQNPVWLFYAPVAGGIGYWVGAGTTKVYVRSAQSPYAETEITRLAGAYAATEDKKWNGGMYGGLMVLNNGVDEPQVWSPVASGTKLVNLSTFGTSPWVSTTRAGVFKPFGRFLVALDITKVATRYPLMVKWSHPADGGAMPVSWNEADPAVDAGEFSLQDASGVLVDMVKLRDINVLYTTDQVWGMRFTGGNDIFGFAPLLPTHGCLAQHCVAAFRKDTEFHLVLTGDDIYVHNGQTPQSVVTPQMRRWFFQQLDVTNYARSFVVTNPAYSEIWVCVPEAGAEQPTLALVWNWDTGAIGFRDLLDSTSASDTRTTAATQGTGCITQGFVADIAAESWSSDSNSWNSDTSLWEVRTSSPAVPRLMMLDRSAGKRTFLLDSGADFDSASIPWYVERTGLAIIGRDRQGNPKNDTEMVKLLTEIWPRLECNAGVAFTINVGTQENQEDPVSWSDPYTYTVGTDRFQSVYHSGRYLSFRFAQTGLVQFRMPGYALELTNAGRYN